MTDFCYSEVSVIEVGVSIGGTRVCRFLDRLFLTHLLQGTLIVDNGPQFAGTTLATWVSQYGVYLHSM